MSDVVTDLPTLPRAAAERLAARMARIVARADRARRPHALPPPQVLVTAPGFEFTTGDRPRAFHAASVGKVMTATRAFQLSDEGLLDLDAPLVRLLPPADREGLFLSAGEDGAARVTPRDLLAHTSGAADYFDGRTDAPTSFRRQVTIERDHRWTPGELLAYSRDHQHPVASPGVRFSYSDTGYVLLGRVIEETGGAPLGAQLHEHVFAPAGMDASCLLFHTMPDGTASDSDHPAADLDIAPLWIGRSELSRATSLSCDWGGGGVVTTLDDVDRFLLAWSGGALLSPASFARMTDARHRFRPGIRYGMGAMRVHYDGFSPFLRGMPRPVGHLGVTAVHAFTVPELGIRIVMNFHSTREMVRSFRVQIALMRLLVQALSR